MPKELMDMNSGELKALRANLPDETTQAERDALNDRIADLTVAEGLTAGMAARDKRDSAKAMDAKAYKRWPGLRDKESEFYKAVETVMEARGDSETNERALMDAANEVGMEMGEAPVGWVPAESAMKMMNIKAGGDEGASEGSSIKYTDKHQKTLDFLAKEGLINKEDEASMARINKGTGEEA